jgi:large subunit ribosomal protein L18
MNKTRIQRETRIRKNLGRVSTRPRLTIVRSNKYCYAQVIANNGDTIIGVSEKALQGTTKVAPMERAKALGKKIAELAAEKKIKEVAFDKGRLAYHGRVKAIAEGAREGGLQF